MPVTILIIESHVAVQQALRDWLEAVFPHSLRIKTTCQENAIKLVQAESPHIIIMDINNPGGNGLEMTKCIKTISPLAKIVVMSSYNDDFYRAKAAEVGANAYIPKQDLLSELIPTLDTLLANLEEQHLPSRHVSD